jgi:hypothetical protein
MQNKKDKTVKKKPQKGPLISLTARNYRIFGLAVLVLIVGYIFMSIGPASSFWSLTLAPIILVIGYCILIPLAIFYKGPNKDYIKKSG